MPIIRTSFSSEAKLCLDTRKMDLGGKGLAKVQIGALSPSGMTNIHDGCISHNV